MSIVGGFEIILGYILEFDMPGAPEGWRKAHSGPALNGMMVIAIAVVLPPKLLTHAPTASIPRDTRKPERERILPECGAKVKDRLRGERIPQRRVIGV